MLHLLRDYVQNRWIYASPYAFILYLFLFPLNFPFTNGCDTRGFDFFTAEQCSSGSYIIDTQCPRDAGTLRGDVLGAVGATSAAK
jgi:hypothetical protein